MVSCGVAPERLYVNEFNFLRWATPSRFGLPAAWLVDGQVERGRFALWPAFDDSSRV